MENSPKQRIAAALVHSYHEVGGINRIDCSHLPSKATIASICDELLQLLFPGFFDTEEVHSENLQSLTEQRIARIVERLVPEVAKSLQFQETTSGKKDPRSPDEVVCSFLEGLSGVRQLLRTDVEAAYEGDPAADSYQVIILSYPAVEAISIQRLAHLLYRAQVPLIPRIMTEWAHGRTGIDIHPGASIGSHFFIDHGTGVVIGETCTIGNHVKLYHGVTLGARSFPRDEQGHIVKGNKRHPDVKDQVTIYPNATILGGQTVLGEGSTVGANVFLRSSIPPQTLVTTEGAALRFLDKVTGAELELVGEKILPATLP